MTVAKNANSFLVFEEVDFDDFKFMLMNQGHSEEIGSVGSQYEEELKNNSPDTYTLGLYACEKLIGVLSFGTLELPYGDKEFTGRMDVVITVNSCRGQGVGSLLITRFLQILLDKYGDKLKSVSTIAMHPAIVNCVAELGFNGPPNLSPTPRYNIVFDSAEERESFKKRVDGHFQKKFQRIKMKCLDCQNKTWITPWCRESK